MSISAAVCVVFATLELFPRCHGRTSFAAGVNQIPGEEWTYLERQMLLSSYSHYIDMT